MSAVLFVSTAVLLYQFWTGALAPDAAQTAADPAAAVDVTAPSLDRAA